MRHVNKNDPPQPAGGSAACAIRRRPDCREVIPGSKRLGPDEKTLGCSCGLGDGVSI